MSCLADVTCGNMEVDFTLGTGDGLTGVLDFCENAMNSILLNFHSNMALNLLFDYYLILHNDSIESWSDFHCLSTSQES